MTTKTHCTTTTHTMSFYTSLPTTQAHQLSITSLNVLADVCVDEPKTGLGSFLTPPPPPVLVSS